jgi:hypothetical protein
MTCAVNFIGVLVVLVAVCQFLEIFYQLLNDNIDWWYVLVGVLLCVPLIIGLAFAICFFNEEKDSTRRLLLIGLILTIISLTLSAVWNSVYFWFFYHHAEVVTGNDGVGYTKATRKQEIVFSAYFALVADCLFAYFICVLHNYIEAHREKAIKKFIDREDLPEDLKALLDKSAAPADPEADDTKPKNAIPDVPVTDPVAE